MAEKGSSDSSIETRFPKAVTSPRTPHREFDPRNFAKRAGLNRDRAALCSVAVIVDALPRRFDMRYFLSTLCWLAFIVVGLPSIVIAFLPPRLSTDQGDGRAWADVMMLCDAVALYTLHIGQLPPDLDALLVAPDDLPAEGGWKGPYLDRPVPVDPWGNDYRYAIDPKLPFTVCIWSCGKDAISGTADDLSSEDYKNAQAAAGPAIWNPLSRY